MYASTSRSRRSNRCTISFGTAPGILRALANNSSTRPLIGVIGLRNSCAAIARKSSRARSSASSSAIRASNMISRSAWEERAGEWPTGIFPIVVCGRSLKMRCSPELIARRKLAFDETALRAVAFQASDLVGIPSSPWGETLQPERNDSGCETRRYRTARGRRSSPCSPTTISPTGIVPGWWMGRVTTQRSRKLMMDVFRRISALSRKQFSSAAGTITESLE